MNNRFLFSSIIAGLGILGATIACGNGSASGDDTTQGELGRTEEAAGNIDESIVGTWVDDSGDQLLVHTLELREDGTFHAKGGCRVGDDGTRRCYEVEEAKGKWSTESANLRAASWIVLKVRGGKEQRFLYTPGRLAGMGNDALLFSKQPNDSKRAKFKKLATDALAPGDICVAGRSCSEGFECRSNCPRNAMCIVAIDTCQPVAVIQRGGVCGHDTNPEARCADGLVCKDNCPQGAMCFVSIFTCQPR